MNCTNCAAPLPPKSNRCSYCGTLNDTDLRSVGGGVRSGSVDRSCPRCEVALHALALRSDGGLEVDRCDECLGIFFDPSELEQLLDGSVGEKRVIDRGRLDTLIEEEAPADPELRYLPCPECKSLMNRRSYAARAGVIVDWCGDHGVWLDGGEVGQLLRWARAGGRELDKHTTAEKGRLEERRQRQSQAFDQLERVMARTEARGTGARYRESDLTDALGSFLGLLIG